MSILIDAGPLYALINHREYYHRWAIAQVDRFAPPYYTCEAVLSEAHFLLGRAHGGSKQLNKMIADGGIVPAFSYADHIDRVNALMETYADVPMSFADACLVRMAEIHPKGWIFTTDGDFRIYRKDKTDRLDVIMPW